MYPASAIKQHLKNYQQLPLGDQDYINLVTSFNPRYHSLKSVFAINAAQPGSALAPANSTTGSLIPAALEETSLPTPASDHPIDACVEKNPPPLTQAPSEDDDFSWLSDGLPALPLAYSPRSTSAFSQPSSSLFFKSQINTLEQKAELASVSETPVDDNRTSSPVLFNF